MRKSFGLFVLLLSLVLIPVASLAGGSPRQHDGGFMLRMTGGFGGGSSSISDSTNEVEFSGGQGEFTIAIGGVVTENLAIHGTLFGFSMVDPEVKFNSTSLGNSSGSMTMSAVAGGLTWWVMPANFYLSGSAGIGSLSWDPDGSGSSSSDAGFAMELALGKEWFVSDSWGLGIGGGFSWHTIPDGDIPENWSGVSISVRFSATFN